MNRSQHTIECGAEITGQAEACPTLENKEART